MGDEVSTVVFGKGVAGLAPELAQYGAAKVLVTKMIFLLSTILVHMWLSWRP